MEVLCSSINPSSLYFHNTDLLYLPQVSPGVNSIIIILMLNILSFGLMFIFVTINFDPPHAYLCCINMNRAKLPESVQPHILALV